ncbi:MAG: methyltransferase domain-containing protein [Flavobacteriaceae bacterium]|nr:methyltransferase domain-containing protein [Flavobacteriaceae bacterium]
MASKITKCILKNIPRSWLIRLSYVAMPLLDVFLRGKAYHDPINQTSYRRFLSYGYNDVRKNVLSPGTLSLERHRLLWLYLKAETDFFKKRLNVLHFAPEQCFRKRFKKFKNLSITTTDLEAPHVDVKADICHLPFEDNSFDVILCNHVLEHIPDDIKAMSELYRVMKPGGWGIFQIPLDNARLKTYEDASITSPDARTKAFGQYDHVRLYGMDFFERLSEVGFEVAAVDYTQNFTESEIEQYRLAKGELIPLVRKLQGLKT